MHLRVPTLQYGRLLNSAFSLEEAQRGMPRWGFHPLPACLETKPESPTTTRQPPATSGLRVSGTLVHSISRTTASRKRKRNQVSGCYEGKRLEYYNQTSTLSACPITDNHRESSRAEVERCGILCTGSVRR